MTYPAGIDWIAQFRDENERLRVANAALLAALKACVKNAEDDEPLKESGWWSEDGINAIEAGRAAIKLAEGDKSDAPLLAAVASGGPGMSDATQIIDLRLEVSDLRAEMERLLRLRAQRDAMLAALKHFAGC